MDTQEIRQNSTLKIGIATQRELADKMGKEFADQIYDDGSAEEKRKHLQNIYFRYTRFLMRDNMGTNDLDADELYELEQIIKILDPNHNEYGTRESQ